MQFQISRSGRALLAAKGQWYNECKSRVKEVDTRILNGRGKKNESRLCDAECKIAMARGPGTVWFSPFAFLG